MQDAKINYMLDLRSREKSVAYFENNRRRAPNEALSDKRLLIIKYS